jgi:hypothetical protein
VNLLIFQRVHEGFAEGVVFYGVRACCWTISREICRMQDADGVIALQAKEVLKSLNRMAFDLYQVTRNTDGGSCKTFGQTNVCFSRLAHLSFGEEIWREDVFRVCAMQSLRGLRQRRTVVRFMREGEGGRAYRGPPWC